MVGPPQSFVPTERSPAIVITRARIMKPALIVRDGKQAGRAVPLPDTIFLIGRDPQCHLRPHCPSVSKLHCAIVTWAGILRVRDLKSRNGTYLNGVPVNGEAIVHDGDHLQVGTFAFTFRVGNQDGSPLTTPIEEQEVKWLLDVPGDADVLSTSTPTRIVQNENEEQADETLNTAPGTLAASESGPSVRKRPSKVVSAGQHFRDYFAQRKHRPAD